jgi:hypothetical protein
MDKKSKILQGIGTMKITINISKKKRMVFMDALAILFDILDDPRCDNRKIISLRKEYKFTDDHEMAMINVYEKFGGIYGE